MKQFTYFLRIKPSFGKKMAMTTTRQSFLRRKQRYGYQIREKKLLLKISALLLGLPKGGDLVRGVSV